MAISQDWQFDLNGVTWGRGVTPTGFSAGTTIAVTELTGLDHPDVNSLVSVRSNQHGAFISARYHAHRVWVLQARMNTSAANFAADIYALKGLFTSVASGVTVPFSFKMPNVVQQVSNVNPAGVKYPVRTIETAVGWVDFTATLLAGDPRIYSYALNTSPVETVAGGAFSLTNAGNFPAPTLITFTGPLTNPVLTDSTTGINWGATIVLGTGDTLVVNSLLNTVTYTTGGVSSTKFSTMNATSDWLTLQPGANSLALTAASGTGNVVVSWNDTWL
ncbi:MAG: phage tail family protein [Pseudomonadota bacterium]|nr:phage tail family protein [Pseudomonadota bacterium]